MVAGLVISAVKSLNNEIGVSKLSDKYAPHTLVTRYDVPNYNQLMELTFGDHVEVKNINERTNYTSHIRYQQWHCIHLVIYNEGGG